jgi:hypothetical protein
VSHIVVAAHVHGVSINGRRYRGRHQDRTPRASEQGLPLQHRQARHVSRVELHPAHAAPPVITGFIGRENMVAEDQLAVVVRQEHAVFQVSLRASPVHGGRRPPRRMLLARRGSDHRDVLRVDEAGAALERQRRDDAVVEREARPQQVPGFGYGTGRSSGS